MLNGRIRLNPVDALPFVLIDVDCVVEVAVRLLVVCIVVARWAVGVAVGPLCGCGT
jgi:hypothetical protein